MGVYPPVSVSDASLLAASPRSSPYYAREAVFYRSVGLSRFEAVLLSAGVSLSQQIRDLQRGCDVVVGTPGRIIDLIENSRALTLSQVRSCCVYKLASSPIKVRDLSPWSPGYQGQFIHRGDDICNNTLHGILLLKAAVFSDKRACKKLALIFPHSSRARLLCMCVAKCACSPCPALSKGGTQSHPGELPHV